jgi:mono/diheme cytochrome c family protein
MADTRDPKYSENPETQSPATPAPTEQSELFMTEEEVEPHKDKGHYDVVSDIKVGHAGVPKFLKFVYAILAVWGLYYALTAAPINDRMEASPSDQPTAEAGADIFATTCAGCHNVTAERKIGPGMLGVYQRLGDQGLSDVLHNGRPQTGMPAPPSLGLNENQIKSLELYLKALK